MTCRRLGFLRFDVYTYVLYSFAVHINGESFGSLASTSAYHDITLAPHSQAVANAGDWRESDMIVSYEFGSQNEMPHTAIRQDTADYLP